MSEDEKTPDLFETVREVVRPVTWDEARAARDGGIAQSADHAEREVPDWGERAYAFLETFARATDRSFLAEEVVAAASSKIPPPPDLRAWGGIFQRASKRNLIERAGAAPAKTSRLGLKTLWRGVK